MANYYIATGTVADFYQEVAGYYLEHHDKVNALRWLKTGNKMFPTANLQNEINILERELSNLQKTSAGSPS